MSSVAIGEAVEAVLAQLDDLDQADRVRALESATKLVADVPRWSGVFVAHADGTFTCDTCLDDIPARDELGNAFRAHVCKEGCLHGDASAMPFERRADLDRGESQAWRNAYLTVWTPRDFDPSDDRTQVWEEGSDGWLSPVVCRGCKRSIAVVVDGDKESTDDTTRVARALDCLREARTLLVKSRAPRAAARVRSALKSAEGAARNVSVRRGRVERARRVLGWPAHVPLAMPGGVGYPGAFT